jgi:acid phosphatase family membrane protein YuiD
MSIFNIGPDGFLLIEALLVSACVAALAWRRAGLAAGISATAVIAIAVVLFNASSLNATPGLNYRIVTALFILVPSALLLGASRLRWIATHAWVLVLAGPILFVGCYVGICELCVKTGLI